MRLQRAGFKIGTLAASARTRIAWSRACDAAHPWMAP